MFPQFQRRRNKKSKKFQRQKSRKTIKFFMCKYQKNRASDASCSVCLLKTFKNLKNTRKILEERVKTCIQSAINKEKSRMFTFVTGWALSLKMKVELRAIYTQKSYQESTKKLPKVHKKVLRKNQNLSNFLNLT